MMIFVARRGISRKAPWVFKQTSPVAVVKPISSDAVMIELMSSLGKGFSYAFNSICDAFESQDPEVLEQCLEPTLYKHVFSRFELLNSHGYRFKRTSEREPKVTLQNLQLTLGVNINRANNPKKTEYLMVTSLEDIKKNLPLDVLKSKVEQEGININEKILNTCMDYAWLYILPKAPANIILSLDVIFESENPLTLVKDDKDQIYKEKTNEFHMLRFESEVLRLGMQKDVMGKFDTVFKELKEIKNSFLSHPWVVADIDNTALGNPFTK